MKHDAWPGEREILQFQVRDGDGLLTTHRLIIDTIKYSRRRKQMMQQPTEFYSLRDFQKAVIADEHNKTIVCAKISFSYFLHRL